MWTHFILKETGRGNKSNDEQSSNKKNFIKKSQSKMLHKLVISTGGTLKCFNFVNENIFILW